MTNWKVWTVGKVYSKTELEEIARKRINEEPDKIETNIATIKEWISKQPHLEENGRKDNGFIHVYLRGCKYNLEDTKQRLDTWHSVRTRYPEMFENWNYKDPKIKELISAGTCIPLQGFDKHGRRVLILRGSAADPNKFTMLDQFRVNFMVTELLMNDHGDSQGQICGVVVIQDISAASLRHLKNFSPTVVKNAMTVTQEAYPANPNAMYVYGLPGFVKGVFNVLMSFLTEKFRKIMQFVGKDDFSRLHEDLGIEILPKEYGGTNKTVQDHLDVLMSNMEANQTWLTEQIKHKSNEERRLKSH